MWAKYSRKWTAKKLQAEIAERSKKIIKRKIDALMDLHMSGI